MGIFVSNLLHVPLYGQCIYLKYKHINGIPFMTKHLEFVCREKIVLPTKTNGCWWTYNLL